MKREIGLAILLAMPGLACHINAQSLSQAQPIQIGRGTVIAFYVPANRAADADADSNEALSDFQLYAERVKQPLANLNIDFRVLYVRSFRLRVDGRSIEFRPKSDSVGYYLIAPGRRPRVEYGVMTDSDLLQVTRHYFGLPKSPE